MKQEAGEKRWGEKLGAPRGIVSFLLVSAPVLSRAVDVAASVICGNPSMVAAISRYSRNSP
jgi:hypothetical protein